MNDENIKELKKQHIENYKKAILENIKNNTKSLVFDDINSLIIQPPLDSMDLLKTKFLNLAKKNKIVLNTEKLNDLLDHYRKSISKCLNKISKYRIDILSSKLDGFKFDDEDIFVFYKKDLADVNKNMKKEFKSQIVDSYEKVIVKDIDKVFFDDIDESIKNKIKEEVLKYFKGMYQRQLLENYEIKVMVKDTTLINGVKEQSNHYLFTLKNSRLLNLD